MAADYSRSHHPDYGQLTAFLGRCEEQRITLTFTQLEQEVLSGLLPYPARLYRAWWSNKPGARGIQNRGWLSAGWRALSVNLIVGRVTFERAGPVEP